MRTGARVRARETFRVGMRGVVGAFRFAFLCAYTCVRGGACAYRCACGGGVGCNGAGSFERRRVPWLLRIHRLHKQIFDLPPTHTAYSNRYAIYRLHQQVSDLPFTFTAYSLPLTPTGVRVTAHVGGMRLPLTSYCLSAYYYLLRKNGYVYLLCFIYYP